MVGELTNEIIGARDARPAEERVGDSLHAMLSLRDAPALMRGRAALAANVLGVARRRGLLHLENERVRGAVAEDEYDVVACTDAAGADHLERDVDRTVRVEDELPIRAEVSRYVLQRREDAAP